MALTHIEDFAANIFSFFTYITKPQCIDNNSTKENCPNKKTSLFILNVSIVLEIA